MRFGDCKFAILDLEWLLQHTNMMLMEEVPLYESKGKQFKARQNTGLPVGLTPEIVAQAQKKKGQGGTIQPIPGMIINVEKKKKKKKSGVEEATEKLSKCEIIEPTFSTPVSLSNNSTPSSDPAKRLKNLKKKLRDIEMLEEKIKSGMLKNPDKDQKEKLSKKNDIVNEIEKLEIASD
ncbi:PREDICTED: partner of Y14 and mago isoform X2 [Papilio polytes]|uniref:partner of Y14 and mago isoform X2 n=1 Tax=Papilio polytes TaxID=76194 RepID=UPI000675C1D2|nr:PREDICTED: partner of Y14 and mago isoform X2 [Papilio polytes]